MTFTDPKERAKAFGVFGALAGGGAAIGLIVGGVLTEYASWRWCLGVNVPVALLVAGFAFPLVHESKAHGDTRYDVPGVLLATLGLFSLVYGFTEAARAKHPEIQGDTSVLGWTAPSTLAFLATAVVLLIAFVWWETRAKNPMLPLRVVLDRNRGGSYLTFLLVGAGLFAMFLFLTYYFQLNLGWSPLKAGFAFLPFSIGIILTAGVVAQLLPRFGPKPLMIPGLVMAVVGMLLLTQIGQDTSYWTHVLPGDDPDERRAGRRLHPGIEHGADRGGAPRRGGRERGAQHLAADRRVARHGAAQHAVRRRGDVLLRRQPVDRLQQPQGDVEAGVPARLPRLVLLGRGAAGGGAGRGVHRHQRQEAGRAERRGRGIVA